jgi:hypothetical protein
MGTLPTPADATNRDPRLKAEDDSRRGQGEEPDCLLPRSRNQTGGSAFATMMARSSVEDVRSSGVVM